MRKEYLEIWELIKQLSYGEIQQLKTELDNLHTGSIAKEPSQYAVSDSPRTYQTHAWSDEEPEDSPYLADFNQFLELIQFQQGVNKLTFIPGKLHRAIIEFIDQVKGIRKPQAIRQAGLGKGLIQMASDFDDPLDDFKAYM